MRARRTNPNYALILKTCALSDLNRYKICSEPLVLTSVLALVEVGLGASLTYAVMIAIAFG